jgi:hypothetical protein
MIKCRSRLFLILKTHPDGYDSITVLFASTELEQDLQPASVTAIGSFLCLNA